MHGAPPLRIELYSDILLAVGDVGSFADETAYLGFGFGFHNFTSYT